MKREFVERGEEVMRIAGHVRRKYFGWVRGVDFEEMEAEGVLSVYEHAERFDERRGNFTTFVCMWVENGMHRFLREEAKKKRMNVDLDAVGDIFGVEEKMEEGQKDNIGKILKCAEGLTPLRKEIIRGLMTEKSQVNVARQKGVSKQYVSMTMSVIANKVRKKYDLVDGVLCEKEMDK